MRFELLNNLCCSDGLFQLSFQGELLSGKKIPEVDVKLFACGYPMNPVMDTIRPGQFMVLAQDLEFETARKQMKHWMKLGIITYIEPMRPTLVNS